MPRHRHSGRTLLALLLAAAATLPAVASDLNQLDLGSQRPRLRVRSGRQFVFKTGVLQRDHLARWVLSDGTLLDLEPRAVWVDANSPGAPAEPREGRTVRVMGLPGPHGLRVSHGTLLTFEEALGSLRPMPETPPDIEVAPRPQ